MKFSTATAADCLPKPGPFSTRQPFEANLSLQCPTITDSNSRPILALLVAGHCFPPLCLSGVPPEGLPSIPLDFRAVFAKQWSEYFSCQVPHQGQGEGCPRQDVSVGSGAVSQSTQAALLSKFQGCSFCTFFIFCKNLRVFFFLIGFFLSRFLLENCLTEEDPAFGLLKSNLSTIRFRKSIFFESARSRNFDHHEFRIFPHFCQPPQRHNIEFVFFVVFF